MKILCILGTRPEAIKMAPVIHRLQETAWAQVRVLATAQHREMLDQVLNLFNIVPDLDLNLMKKNQTLPQLTANLISSLDTCLQIERPDAILAQGDTTTVMAAAISAYYSQIPFGHIEAGLRTRDIYNPFPEEMNRLIATRIARWHFAPTESAKLNLLAEGIPEHAIFVTGNTVIDALLSTANRCENATPPVAPGNRLILLTAHRRENFGEPLLNICRAVKYLVDTRNDIEFLVPVHPNPNVKELVHGLLGNHPRIRLSQPLDYLPFVSAMKKAEFILTDSGGIQEEAPALGKPVLVLRKETERPEAVQAGVVKLVGTDCASIISESLRLLDEDETYKSMAKGASPYGDGNAAVRIRDILMQSNLAQI